MTHEDAMKDWMQGELLKAVTGNTVAQEMEIDIEKVRQQIAEAMAIPRELQMPTYILHTTDNLSMKVDLLNKDMMEVYAYEMERGGTLYEINESAFSDLLKPLSWN